jgi:SWIM zinc finger
LGVIINCSLSVSEFEFRWKALLEEYKLHDNKHLKVMYNSRSQWVPTYFRDYFFADMSTTQRSESINALFKIWVNNHTSIYQFVKRIEKMIEGIWQRESDEDLKSVNEIPKCLTPYKMEVQACEVYTKTVFLVFKRIIKDSLLGVVTEVNKDVKYRVDITYHPQISNFEPESYMVEVDKASEIVLCNCKGFEFEGLICSHAIKIMHHIGMINLPLKYILPRWRKDANTILKRSINERSMEKGGTIELQTMRFAAIKSELMELGKMGVVSLDHFEYLKSLIAEGKEKLKLMSIEKGYEGAEGISESEATPEEERTHSEIQTYLDPPDS